MVERSVLEDAVRVRLPDGAFLNVFWICVGKSGDSLAWEMNVSFVWWWLVQVRVRWETKWFVLKLSDSCRQHGLHQVNKHD